VSRSPLQALAILPLLVGLGHHLRVRLGRLGGAGTEQVGLAGALVLLVLLGHFQCEGQLQHQGVAVGTQGVDGSRADQGLQHPAVGLAQVDLPAECEQALDASALSACGQYALDGGLAHPLDGPLAVDHGALAVRGELVGRTVDVEVDVDIHLAPQRQVTVHPAAPSGDPLPPNRL